MKVQKRGTKSLVSVVMPVYNAGGFLVPAIKSILNQTFKNFELIIIDDASTDKSLEVIKKFQNKFPQKIRLIQMSKTLNRGGDMCANEGIKVAKGKYIARMDADDVAHHERLEKQVEFLEKNKDIFLVGSNAYVIDKKGEITGEKLEPETNQEIYDSYFTFHPIIHPTAMFRRKYADKTFAYDIKYSANNDYYTFFKLICKNLKFANIQEKLIYYRIHGANDTFIHIKQKFLNTLKVRIQMVMKYGYEPNLKQVATTVVQSLITFILPEKLTAKLYLIAKGIVKPELSFKKIFFKTPAVQ